MYKSNTRVFSGMAEIYDRSRPELPVALTGSAESYLGHAPACVVDVGCGTGKSLNAWVKKAGLIYGVEPNEDMRAVAERNYADVPNVSIMDGCGEKIDLPDRSVDIITCVQVFHWLDEKEALPEFDRILKPGGVLLACDFEFPPLGLWQADKAYADLLQLQKDMDKKYPELNRDVMEGDKIQNLQKIKDCGYFDYCRNASFVDTEEFDAERFIALAFSQSPLDRMVKAGIEEVKEPITKFRQTVEKAFQGGTANVSFGMKLTLAVKK